MLVEQAKNHHSLVAYEYPMIDIKNFIPGNSRTHLAGILILLSLLSAVAISSAANRAVSVWSAARDLSPGHAIAASDLKKVKVNLFDSARKYSSINSHVLGMRINRSISSGELIPVSILTRQSAPITTQSLPLRIYRSDMPIDLTPGQSVDLYALPTNTTPDGVEPILAYTNATIESIDQKSKDLGGDIGIVVAIPKIAMPQVVTDISHSKVLVVRNGF